MTTPFDGTKAPRSAGGPLAGPHGETALSVEHLHKKFGDHVAVADVSFHVRTGETVCLLGPNGAGKTTIIEICEGFTHPTSGRVEVLGFNPATSPDAVRERIGIMLQGGGSYSGVRVREMLELTASYKRNTLDPEWLLSILGLQHNANNTYRRLSGGQKQRLSLALALVGRPELVFLDEPTAGMDAQSRLLVWDLISALKRDGVSVVLTTHHLDEAESLGDRVYIIDKGQDVANGTPAELTRAYHGGMLTFETDCEVDLQALESAGLKAHKLRPLNYSVTMAVGESQSQGENEGDSTPVTPGHLELLTRELARQNVLARRINASSATLEDVFLELTGRELNQD